MAETEMADDGMTVLKVPSPHDEGGYLEVKKCDWYDDFELLELVWGNNDYAVGVSLNQIYPEGFEDFEASLDLFSHDCVSLLRYVECVLN